MLKYKTLFIIGGTGTLESAMLRRLLGADSKSKHT